MFFGHPALFHYFHFQLGFYPIDNKKNIFQSNTFLCMIKIISSIYEISKFNIDLFIFFAPKFYFLLISYLLLFLLNFHYNKVFSCNNETSLNRRFTAYHENNLGIALRQPVLFQFTYFTPNWDFISWKTKNIVQNNKLLCTKKIWAAFVKYANHNIDFLSFFLLPEFYFFLCEKTESKFSSRELKKNRNYDKRKLKVICFLFDF